MGDVDRDADLELSVKEMFQGRSSGSVESISICIATQTCEMSLLTLAVTWCVSRVCSHGVTSWSLPERHLMRFLGMPSWVV